MTMSNLVYLNLDLNFFTDDIMRSMSAFPSLRYLSMKGSFLTARGTLFANGRPNLPYLEVLLLTMNGFSGTLPIDDLTYFHNLEVLDLSSNNFVGSIPLTIKSLSSLKAISLAENMLNGSLPNGLCELKNLHTLDLSHNNFHGSLPECFNSLSFLKLFDISSNQFTGMLQPSLIANLTSLEYVDFSHNKFEGSFSFSLFSNHTKLEVVAFINDNDNFMFKVETEHPAGWTPMFQLKVLVLSNCNLKVIVPSFLLCQKKLEILDMSYNSLEGRFPKWLIENNTNLQVIHLGTNYFSGSLSMPYRIVPYISYLNLSRNLFDGAIPPSLGLLNSMHVLDLSHNKFSGEVPKGLLTNGFSLLKLSNNSLHGEILSGNFSLGLIENLLLDSNCFTGNIGNETITSWDDFLVLDISNNFFTGSIPDWISNIGGAFVARNNRLGGQLPCGTTSLSFLDISQNYFSGTISSCLNIQSLEHLHLASNQFHGSIPNSFRNMTNVLTLSIGDNSLSGSIPKFVGELVNLRVLLLEKNEFTGPIPKELCQLTNVSLIDLSSNSLSGSIPACLQNITGPSHLAYDHIFIPLSLAHFYSIGEYDILNKAYSSIEQSDIEIYDIQDEVQFTTKRMSRPYKGIVLYLISGLDLSYNKLSGDIPQELGLLSKIHVLNLSHNQLTGSIPVNFSNLASIESLDLSFNNLTGEVPSEFTKLNSLAVFNVSFNNLSGRLPEMKGQFGTFGKESYEGNPLLCGPPLDNKCLEESQGTHPSHEEGNDEKWYEMDMRICLADNFKLADLLNSGSFQILNASSSHRCFLINPPGEITSPPSGVVPNLFFGVGFRRRLPAYLGQPLDDPYTVTGVLVTSPST
ncbi:receptor-like protein 13 [Helianthus annuus]|uniref:receptor-like protein 13 n=1 Tax=Helianthus annuus TaxID=4232 RepID=UPI0016530A37|nr:receptor-like protein 13 [Helianthus annuus]